MKIIVNSEEQKEMLIEQSKYIHDFMEVVRYRDKNNMIREKWVGLNSDKAGILMHIYTNPDIIVVNK